MRKNTNTYRAEHPLFQIGDKILINAKNIRTRRPSKKLNHRYLELFPITKLIGTKAVRVGLSKTMHCHNVFHVSLLEPYRRNTFDGRRKRLPKSMIVDGDEKYEPKKILQTE